MKILHVPYCFYPDPVGGTEVYVANLAKALTAQGIESLIAAPGERDAAYVVDGLQVRRYAVLPELSDLSELYGEGDSAAAEKFARILEEEKPNVVHLHAFSRACSLRIVRQAKRRGCRVVFTYHTPTVSCQRGTLMRWGTEPCDGRLRPILCAACTLQGLRVPRFLARGLALVPAGIGQALGRAGLSGAPWTALRMHQLMTLRHRTLRTLWGEVHHIVVPSLWARDLLLRNGVLSGRVTLCRHGIAEQTQQTRTSDGVATGTSGRLRVVFFGRFHPTKGIHILIQAVRADPSLAVGLSIYGVMQGKEESAYQEHLRFLAKADSRISFPQPISSDRVIECLRGYDLLAVPSLSFETGPQVVLEAFAAGVPVLGSRLGGLTEWIEDGVNGLWIEPGSIEDWRRQLERLSTDPQKMISLRSGIRFPRTMKAVAEEMARLYESLLP